MTAGAAAGSGVALGPRSRPGLSSGGRGLGRRRRRGRPWAGLILPGRKSGDVHAFDQAITSSWSGALEDRGVAVAPGSACRFAFDKADSRARLDDLGYPVPPLRDRRQPAGIVSFGDRYGWPVMAKAACSGYDGRGVPVVVEPGDEAAAAASSRSGDRRRGTGRLRSRNWPSWWPNHPNGDSVTYPLVSTVPGEGMCVSGVLSGRRPRSGRRRGSAPRRRAGGRRRTRRSDGVELFLVDDELLVNELATRPRTTPATTPSKRVSPPSSNNTCKAILDLPLGSTELRAPAAAMRNVVGSPESRTDRTPRRGARVPTGAHHVHLRPSNHDTGRKLGHVTALGATVDEARSVAERAAVGSTARPAPVGERS